MTEQLSRRARLARYIAGPDLAQLAVTVKIDDSPGWSNFVGLPNDRDLAEMQQLYADALTAWRKNPIAKRIVEITTDYTIGDGIGISSGFKPLDKFIPAFWHHSKNHIDRRLESMSEELSRAGDLFPVLFRNQHDGMSYIRFLIKSQVSEITTAVNDWETELSITELPNNLGSEPRTWYTINYPGIEEETAVALHYHINRPIGATLGESDLATMIPWLLRYSRMLEDRVRLHWAARSFLYTVTVPTNQVQAKQNQYANPPESGSVIVKDSGETWDTITPNLRGADASHDMEAVRGMIDAGSGYPPHWRGESGSANLATATAMQAPAERHLKRRQRHFVYMLQDIVATAYNRQSNAQPLPTNDYKTLFKTAVPDVSRDDNLQLAQAAKELTGSLTNLIMETEPKSRTLLRTYLEMTFKFMGEPQSASTLDKILDEIYSTASEEAGS